ncbi:hypothetical protein D3C85_1883000 [compost metagenome]
METAGNFTPQQLNLTPGFLIMSQDLFRMFIEYSASLRQPYFLRGTVQQLAAQLIFQVADMQAYPGLGQIQQFTSP